MEDYSDRKPLAVANWKMAMTISESLAFADRFLPGAAPLSEVMTIVLCPPFTALHALSQTLSGSSLELGAQNLWEKPGETHTGEISADLIADTGCQWVMVGHWEVRRRTQETDSITNKKLHAAFRAGLKPILLIGEGSTEQEQVEDVLNERLPQVFAGCPPEQVAHMALIYEPEWTIDVEEPAPFDHIATGCSFVRSWISESLSAAVARAIRIIYGGSVTPENAKRLLASPDIDGLGAGRKGRDPVAFARIVRLVAESKGLT
jgi:triosephosphate isomerase